MGRFARLALILGQAFIFAAAVIANAWSQTLPLPPGTVVTGEVFKPPFSCPPPSVPSITTGADANQYVCITGATAPFVATDPAAMVVTSVPTQFVRVYCPDASVCSPVSVPNRPFMADPSTLRGMTAAQIQDF